MVNFTIKNWATIALIYEKDTQNVKDFNHAYSEKLFYTISFYFYIFFILFDDDDDDDDDGDNDDVLLSQNGWPPKSVKPCFQPGPLSEILYIALLQRALEQDLHLRRC